MSYRNIFGIAHVKKKHNFSFLDVHDGEKSRDIVCHHCGNRYRKEAGLRQHLASAHSDHRPFKCWHSPCEKGFTTQTRLTQHLRIHTGSKPFKCKLCDYKSNRADNVILHVRKVHKIQNPSRHDDITTFEEELHNEKNEQFPMSNIKNEDSEIPATINTTSLAAIVVNTISG